jgi:hypothetical protein
MWGALGLGGAIVVGALYLGDRIEWAAVQLNALSLIFILGGVAAFLLMLTVMDRIRKAGERREVQARGELP